MERIFIESYYLTSSGDACLTILWFLAIIYEYKINIGSELLTVSVNEMIIYFLDSGH